MKLSVRSAQRNEIDGTVRGTLDTCEITKSFKSTAVRWWRDAAAGKYSGPLDASSSRSEQCRM